MPLIMKHIIWLNLAWQWRYPTDKTGFLFIGTLYFIVTILAGTPMLRTRMVYGWIYNSWWTDEWLICALNDLTWSKMKLCVLNEFTMDDQ